MLYGRASPTTTTLPPLCPPVDLLSTSDAVQRAHHARSTHTKLLCQYLWCCVCKRTAPYRLHGGHFPLCCVVGRPLQISESIESVVPDNVWRSRCQALKNELLAVSHRAEQELQVPSVLLSILCQVACHFEHLIDLSEPGPRHHAGKVAANLQWPEGGHHRADWKNQGITEKPTGTCCKLTATGIQAVCHPLILKKPICSIIQSCWVTQP